MGSVAENLAAVRERIDAACRPAGRDPAEVRLLPVSKTHGPELIAEAYAAGVRLFGENRVQEAAEKAELFADRPDLGWAMIGHLQTNKAKDWWRRSRRSSTRWTRSRWPRRSTAACTTPDASLDVFIQVNSSGEPQKFGLPPEEVEQFARDLAPVRHPAGPRADDPGRVLRRPGSRRRLLRADARPAGASCGSSVLPGGYDELSMGMSGDFELAIEYGATTVRVGQAIFGARLRPNEYWPPAADG